VKAVVAVLAATAFVLCASPAAAQSDASPPSCVGDTEAGSVPQIPGGQRLRFGVTPGVETGQIGTAPAAAVPEDRPRHDAALAELRPRSGPFVLRLNRFFWSDREAGFNRFLALAHRYTSAGYGVELQVRYHPDSAQEGDIAAWTAHVREVVRRFGAIRGVVALQIANEVNIAFSRDSSDGAYRGAREALVQGVIAAKDEARRRGLRGLEIGFNWAYRLDPATETSFWSALRDRGGAAFARSLDWIGLDAYPGTIFPPAEPDLDGYRDGMVNAMSAIRCYAKLPGIPRSVPVKVEENGWPTFLGRSYATQAAVLERMVRAVHDFRATYGVTDYRWFNLRDSDTASQQIFQRAGLIESDYDRKPAFGVYERLVERLSIRGGLSGARPRLSLRVRYRRGRWRGRSCARGPVRATVTGADRRLARRADFRRGRRRVARDTRPPLSRIIDRRRHRGRSHRHAVVAKVRLADGGLVRLRRVYRVCAARVRVRP